jgi:hypothetical protein
MDMYDAVTGPEDDWEEGPSDDVVGWCENCGGDRSGYVIAGDDGTVACYCWDCDGELEIDSETTA